MTNDKFQMSDQFKNPKDKLQITNKTQSTNQNFELFVFLTILFQFCYAEKSKKSQARTFCY